MRNAMVVLLALGLLSLVGGANAWIGTRGPSASIASGSDLVVEAKVKCGIDENGNFRCRNVKKHKDDNQDSKNSKTHKCPDGYRVLKKKNKYGAYCEIIPVETKPKQPEPDLGACMEIVVSANQGGGMGCASGDPICGPVNNGKKTCCCPKS